MKKRTLLTRLLALTMAAAVVLTGCSSGSSDSSSNDTAAEDTASEEDSSTEEEETSSEEGETTTTVTADGRTKITAQTNQSLDTFEPFKAKSTMQITDRLVLEPLWSVDDNGDLVGVIAKDWTIDGTTVDVEIYDYVYDSKGNHITASDVVFSYQSFIDGGVNSNATYLASVETTGDYTLRIEMTTEPWTYLLATIRVGIVSQEEYESDDADFVNNPIGTGHYVLTEFISGTKAVFEKRDSHWQSDVDESLVPYTYKANIDVVEYNYITETPQIQNGLVTGALQVGEINATIKEEFESSGEVAVTSIPSNFAHSIALNCYDGLLADNLALRQAILYAIDTSVLATGVTGGTGTMAYTVGADGLLGYPSQVEEEDYYLYDLDKAKELMAEAGYPDGGITLKWVGNTDEDKALAATIVQAQLAEIGISLEISNLTNTSYLEQRVVYAGDWDLCIMDSVTRGSNAEAFRSLVDNEQYTNGNIFGLNDDEMQELLMTALYDTTEENVYALHTYVKETAGLYGTFIDYNFYGHDNNIEELIFAYDGEMAVNATVISDNYDVYVD